jgi:hypothetical protein
LSKMSHRDSVAALGDELAQLRSLYPSLSDGDLSLVRQNLDCYLTLAWEIFEENVLQYGGGNSASFPDMQSRGRMETKADSHN